MKYKVLLVDDEVDLREVLEFQLGDAFEADFHHAASGVEALAKLRSEMFDLVVSDVMMPGISGLEVLRTIREEGMLTPYIVLTGFGDKEKVVLALRAGAYDFFEKPWTESQIQAAAKKAVDIGFQYRDVDRQIEVELDMLGLEAGESRDKMRSSLKKIKLLRFR